MATQPLTTGTGTTSGATATDRAWRALTWLLFLATAVSLLATLILWARVGFAIPPVTFYRSTWIVAMEWIVVVGPGLMGLLLGLQLPGHRIALALAVMGLVVGLQNVANALITDATFAATDAGAAVAWAGSSLTFPICIFLAIFAVLTFPSGRPLSPRWGRVIWLTAIGSLLTFLYNGFAPGFLSWYREFQTRSACPRPGSGGSLWVASLGWRASWRAVFSPAGRW